MPSLRPQARLFKRLALPLLLFSGFAAAGQPRPAPTRVPAEPLHRVAVLAPLSGPSAQLGQAIVNAANLAHADTGGARIRITAYDTARGAAGAASQALADGNGLILGPLLPDDVRLIAPIARRAGVPVVAFASDGGVAGEGVHVLALNPAQSVERVVAFARSRGVQRFAGLTPAGLYGDRAGLAFRQAVQRSGGTLVGVQSYDRSAASLRTAVESLARSGSYEAVLIADGTRVAVQATPLLRRFNPQARVLGTELWAAEASGGANAQLEGAWYAATSDQLFEQFRTRYRARYNRDPARRVSLGYDAVLLAMRVAADWPVGRPFPVRQLRSVEGFLGVDGAFRFGADGIVQRALEVREVTASGMRVVAPAPGGFE